MGDRADEGMARCRRAPRGSRPPGRRATQGRGDAAPMGGACGGAGPSPGAGGNPAVEPSRRKGEGVRGASRSERASLARVEAMGNQDRRTVRREESEVDDGRDQEAVVYGEGKESRDGRGATAPKGVPSGG